MYQTEDMRNGWILPVAEPGRDSLKVRVAHARTELAAVQVQLREMEEGAMVDAFVKLQELVRAFGAKPNDADVNSR
jgi:hypothetical protein